MEQFQRALHKIQMFHWIKFFGYVVCPERPYIPTNGYIEIFNCFKLWCLFNWFNSIASTDKMSLLVQWMEWYDSIHCIINDPKVDQRRLMTQNWMPQTTDQSHKSHNASLPYPTTHHSEQKCAHLWYEWHFVGYIKHVHCGICYLGQLNVFDHIMLCR